MIEQAGSRFLLTAGEMSYALEAAPEGAVNLYWGRKLDRIEDLPSLERRRCCAHRTPRQVEALCREYPVFYGEYYNECALKVSCPDGNRGTRLRFEESRIEGDTLTLLYRGEDYPLELRLFYRIYPGLELVVRWSEIINRGAGEVVVENYASAAFQMPGVMTNYRLTSLTGRWGKEAMIARTPVAPGKAVLESRTGLSGPYTVPFFALDDGTATELSGEVFAGALHWSGNWKITVERDSFGYTAVTGGINEFDNHLTLPPGESITTPFFSGAWSPEGWSGASRVLHRYQMEHLLPRSAVARPLPVIFNSWGCINIHVNEENIRKAALAANRIGAELFVIDDGWQHALGDWYPDPEKFPDGLAPVIAEVAKLGMEFGLWVEIESFEYRSELYKQHPEWALCYPGQKPFERYRADVDRTSVMLNLARRDVAEYMLDSLRNLIRETGIRYLKLDMNCQFSSPGPGLIWNDYVRNLHWIFETLTGEFPEVLMENCASGAARADLGMTRFFGRMNRSDNQDALDVVTLHEGFTYVNHPRMAGGGCNISDSMSHINGRNPPLQYQAFCGMLGSLSCGKDLTQCSDGELDEIRSFVELHKKIRHITHYGSFYRLASARKGSYAAYSYVSPDRSEAVIFILGTSQQFAELLPPVKVPGLKPEAVYGVTAYGGGIPEQGPLSGRGTAEIGLAVDLRGDFDCRILYLKEQ